MEIYVRCLGPIPITSRPYITPNKLYKAEHKYKDFYYITNDIGSKVTIKLYGCGWLGFRNWEIVKDTVIIEQLYRG